MIPLFRAILAETLKLRRSLVLLLAAAPPTMLGLMLLAMLLTGNGADRWDQLALSGAAMWAYLLMPLTVTALTALMAGIEHGCAGWTWSLVQPVPKTVIFVAKALVTIFLMGLISLGIGIAILAAGHIATGLQTSILLEGAPPYAVLASLLVKMWLASLLMTAIQFAIAYGTTNFATPVVVGIGGVFVSVVATSSEYGVFFPWLLPVNMLASAPERAQQALMTGSIGGALVFTLACLWLARRDWR